MDGRLSVRGPVEFCERVRRDASDLGCDPSHVLQADARVIDRLGLERERASEIAQLKAESALLQSFGGIVGGSKSKRSKRPKL
jgi:hypothetical protein